MQKRSFHLSPRVLRLLAVAGMSLAVAGCGCRDNGDPAKQAGHGAVDGNEIVVGHFASLSGNTKAFGTSADQGIQLAVEEINAAGGILVGEKRYTVKLVTRDDNSDANKVPNVIGKLLDENPIAILGEVASGRSIPGGEICEAKGVPMISPASTNPDVTVKNGKLRQYVFRVCFTDDFQGAAAAVFAHRDLGWRKIGILLDRDEPYSKGLAQYFTEALHRFGVSKDAIIELSYSGASATLDVSSQLTEFKNAGIDGMYVPGYYQGVTAIAAQVRQADLRGKGSDRLVLLGGDGWDAPETKANSKGALEGCYFTNHLAPDDPQTPEEKKFLAGYTAKFGEPDSMAPLGYDSMKLLADAIARAGSLDRKKVRDAIEATRNFAGVTGRISIDPLTHNADKPMVVVKIVNNKFMLHSRIAYADAMGPSTAK